jgi:hypothetical protein
LAIFAKEAAKEIVDEGLNRPGIDNTLSRRLVINTAFRCLVLQAQCFIPKQDFIKQVNSIIY